MLSQTRTMVIPILVAGVVLLVRFIKQMKFHKIISLSIIALAVVFILKRLGIYEVVLKRFASENIVGSHSTLTLRIDSVIYNFSDFSIVNWLFGSGFGREIMYYRNFWGKDMLATGTDLEMFIPNYIMKMGLIVFLIMISFVISKLWKCNKIQKSNFHKLILIIMFSILSGGFISGLVGPESSVILGMLFGFSSNKNIN
jgi:hypothetical protein